MRTATGIGAMAIAGMLSGCANTDQSKPATFDKDNDPRVGKTVNQACYTRSISAWSEVDNDKDALLVRLSNDTYYKVSLIGVCDPDLAMRGIAVISRGRSSCFGPGDKIVTDARPRRGAACTIQTIYEWNADTTSDVDQNNKPDLSETEQ